MSRCECHEVSFEEILRYARLLGNDDMTYLMEKVGFGHTCTACHCDVKALLAEQNHDMMAESVLESACVTSQTSPFS